MTDSLATARPDETAHPPRSPWALSFAPARWAAPQPDFVFAQQLAEGSREGWSGSRWSDLLKDAWARQDEAQLWQLLQTRGVALPTADRRAELVALGQEALGWAASRGIAWTPLLDALDSCSDHRFASACEAHLDQHALAREPAAAVPDLRHYRSQTLRRWLARTWGDAVPPALLEWVLRDAQARATLCARPAFVAKHRDLLLMAVLRDNGQFFEPTAARPEGYRVMNAPLEELRTLAPAGLPELVHQAIHRALEEYRRAGRSGDARTFDAWLTLLLSDPTLSRDLLTSLGRLLPSLDASIAASRPKDQVFPFDKGSQIAKSDLVRFAAWTQHQGWGTEDPLAWLDVIRVDGALMTWLRQVALSPASPTSQRGQLATPILDQIRTHARTSPTVEACTNGATLDALSIDHPAMTLLCAGVLEPARAVSMVSALLAKGTLGNRNRLSQLADTQLALQSAEVSRRLLDFLLTNTPGVFLVMTADQVKRLVKQHGPVLPAELLLRVRDAIWAYRPLAAARMSLLRELLPTLTVATHPGASVFNEGWRAWMSSDEADQRLLAVEAMRHLRGLATPTPKRPRATAAHRRP